MQHLNLESLCFLMGFPSQKKWKNTYLLPKDRNFQGQNFCFVVQGPPSRPIRILVWHAVSLPRGSRSKRCLKVTGRWWRDRTILFMPHMCLYFGRLYFYVSLIYGSKDIGMNHEHLVYICLYSINEKTDASDLHYMARSFWPGLQTFNLQHGSFQVQRWNQKRRVKGSDCTSIHLSWSIPSWDRITYPRSHSTLLSQWFSELPSWWDMFSGSLEGNITPYWGRW